MYPRHLSLKLRPPAADARQVERERVIKLVVEQGPVRLVVVHAPAGFGKTTLMAQARQHLQGRDVPTAWLTLDPADNDASRFLACLQATLEEVSGGEDRATRGFAAAPSAPGELAIDLLDRLASTGGPLVLFLDEFEVIHAPAVQSLVAQVIERLPPGGRLVIGSRSQPQLRLGRLRVSGQLRELDSKDLRFSAEETSAFFGQRTHPRLLRSDLSLLHVKTEGWPTALWLASLALERHERGREFIAGFSGTESALATYLAEEVLSQQRDEVQLFLLRTSILSELSAALCEALMPDLDAAAILRELAAANIFVAPIEGEPDTWRYHSLFSSFLRAELRRAHGADIARLHEAAANTFLRQGRQIPAIDHFIAGGNIAGAIGLMTKHALELLTQGRLRLLLRWFEALPQDSLKGFPLLQVTHAWALSYTRGPHPAIALLETEGLAASPDPEVRAHVAGLQACLLVQMDRWEDAYAAGQRALPFMRGASAYANAALVNVSAAAAAVLGLFDQSRHFLDLARQSQGDSASHFHRMYSEGVEGIIDLLDGRFRQSQARFHIALRTSQAPSANAGHGNAWAGLLYAVSLYEENDLRQARHLLEVYLPLAREAWLTDHTILGYALLVRIAFEDGEIDHAFEHLSELEHLGHERHLPRFVAAARLERGWVLLRQGHAEAAARENASAAELAVWRDVGVRRHLAHDWDDPQIARVRWEIVAGDASNAAAGIARLIDQASAQRQPRRLLKLQLLQAMAELRRGHEAAALALALPLLKKCSQEGMVRLFVDEAEVAAGLIAKVQAQANAQDRTQADVQADPIFSDYLARLKRAFGTRAEIAVDPQPARTAEVPKPVEHLTAKEVRLLQLVAEGYSNKALTEKLFVTDSTVRTHLRSIYGKLDATNRTQAVALGRRHGIIR